jgi:hypothetical protein
MALFCVFVSIVCVNHKHTNQIAENASNRDRVFQPELERSVLCTGYISAIYFNNMG